MNDPTQPRRHWRIVVILATASVAVVVLAGLLPPVARGECDGPSCVIDWLMVAYLLLLPVVAGVLLRRSDAFTRWVAAGATWGLVSLAGAVLSFVDMPASDPDRTAFTLMALVLAPFGVLAARGVIGVSAAVAVRVARWRSGEPATSDGSAAESG